MPPEKLAGEVQDMGPAVVSPDAPSDPGKEASKKASQSKALPRKGKPSAASAKAVGDGSGPMKAGAREEVEEDENLEAIAETSEVEEETIEDRVSAMDLSDDVNALTEGGELSEEFKKKAATIFEAAVRAKLRSEMEHLEEKYKAKFESELEEVKNEMAEQVDSYLNYVVEEWMNKNEMAVEHKMKAEIAENFITGLKTLFDENNIAIPDEQFDMLDAAAEKVDELEGKLNEQIENNITLSQENDELKRHEILLDVASDLADTEVEKFSELAESVEYENAEDYRLKLETIKDSYFPKAMINEEVEAAPNYDAEVNSGTMAAYMSAIGRVEKRAS
jgi:hypothetical protein